MQITRMLFPSIIVGKRRGIPAIKGDPVKKNAVMGETMEIRIPLPRPIPMVAIIRIALTIGPVMYTERFLKYWLIIQSANRSAVAVICFVVIFFMLVSFDFILK